MNIVIGGAGDIGFHLADLMVMESQDITLIDLSEEVLQYAANRLDVRTIQGDASSIEVLKSASIQNCDLFIAVATDQNTNLLACILAKKLGAKHTIARVSNAEYLEKTQQVDFKRFGIDNMFSPRVLAVKEIERLIQKSSATDIFEFENGRISILGFTIDNSSSLVGKTFQYFLDNISVDDYRIIGLMRNDITSIPDLDQTIMARDHVYLSSPKRSFEKVYPFVGKNFKKIKKVMIAGYTPIALETAKVLEKKYEVKVIVKGERACKDFARHLSSAVIIQGDPNNADLLEEEGLDQMHVYIALTPNSETNIITSLFAEKAGVYKTIASVDNAAYTHISQGIGIDTIINKKLLAANNIFRFIRKGKIEAIVSFHGVNGEIIEFVIEDSSKLIGKNTNKVDLPDEAIIAGIVRDERGFIPDDKVEFRAGDKVIIFTLQPSIHKVEDIFK
jgi:trk system potassium uptake protein